MSKFWIFVAFLFVCAYFIFPYDFIPDFFGLFGRIDDFSLLGWLIWFVRRQLLRHKRNYRGFYQQNGSSGFHSKQNHEKRNQHYRSNSKKGNDHYYERQDRAKTDREGGEGHDSHVILNVSRSATKDEIKKAYKELTKRYHPDKVAYLGEEFQKIAHKKMVDIQKAYETLMKK